jgi:Linalool dehydratase/isomerase
LSEDYASGGLDRLQIGHLRHLANLARQPPNQWELMKGKGYGQEDFGGYRFQLAYAAYALALTHRHRLPAAPGLFKPIFERLIEKMLLPEVWMYWRDVSRGGSIWNAHLSAGYREEWDPVKSDNIMYSAYVQSMALLYHICSATIATLARARSPSSSGPISGAAKPSNLSTTKTR